MNRVWFGVVLGAVPLLVAARSDSDLVQQLDREVKALRQRVTVLTDLTNDCGVGAEIDPIFPELVQAFASTEVVVTHRGNRTRLMMPASLLFPADSLTIREESNFALDLLATALRSHSQERILITGYTDLGPPALGSSWGYHSSWEVSTAFARAFGEALIHGYGIESNRITLAGRGDQDPVDTNDTAAGRAANRRIVITLSTENLP